MAWDDDDYMHLSCDASIHTRENNTIIGPHERLDICWKIITIAILTQNRQIFPLCVVLYIRRRNHAIEYYYVASSNLNNGKKYYALFRSLLWYIYTY